MLQQETAEIIEISGRSWRFPGAQIDAGSWEIEWRSDGGLYLNDGVGNMVEGIEVDNSEVLTVIPLPSPEERRRREVLLARLLLIALEMLLSDGHTDLAVKIEAAKDMIREFKHVYPETMNV